MATTSIKSIKGRIDHVIIYVENPAKTENKKFTDTVKEYSNNEMQSLTEQDDSENLFLGASKPGTGFVEGNGYIVSWCMGHLADLAGTEVYDKRYSVWRYTDLPIVPEQWKYSVYRDKKGQFDVDCRFALWKDNKFLNPREICLTENIAAALLDDGKVKLNIIKSLKNGKYYSGLRVAAYCRVSTDSDDQLNSYEAQKAYYNISFDEFNDVTVHHLIECIRVMKDKTIEILFKDGSTVCEKI